ncbi:hypothetical protein D0907_02285 [Pseudoalteromonas lipolytica]|uniref:Pyocin activator protein PrtN n=1 Tax=Pseudoalteromonas lipolytica TaxID=570156 RepID=A0AAD0WBG3_9GAMM|nr:MULTISPECIES: pyocin activator PrtN family protein [Pseudoalteromonas]AXV64179.1 hypothetical protein D0907_02285 [Pseudoalteromonas donghaensis]MAD04570.1 hypothetical protein [Pseudoalteromonas sp.]|tara:strand:+ start:36186 stop:36476 length:291 start_codon:yes stop_codon:yes gene_type:complete
MALNSPNQIRITCDLLREQFGQPIFVRLEEISEIYLGMNSTTAKRRASEGALPFPVTRLGDSQKSPWVVRISTLAAFIEQKCQADYNEWSKAQFMN